MTRVKQQWFDSDHRTYVIHFKDCGTSYIQAHGTAWYMRGYCEVYIPRNGLVDIWLARVIHHELLHLVQCAGGRSWEIQHRRADRQWCISKELQSKVPWVTQIFLVKKTVAVPNTGTYYNRVVSNKPQTKNQNRRKHNMSETKNKRVKAERIEVAPNVHKAGNAFYITTTGGIKYCSAERMQKLLDRVEGSYERLVNEYRVRGAKTECVVAG